MVVRGVNPRTGEIAVDFQELARQVASSMSQQLGQGLGGYEAYYNRALRQLNLDGEIRDQLEQLSEFVQSETLDAYDRDFGPSRVGPGSYRQGDNRLSGAMRRALASDNMVLNTGRTLVFGNTRFLDGEAAHWRRLNFGAGAKGEATYRRRSFNLSQPGAAANLPRIRLGIAGTPSPGFSIPRGIFIDGLPTEGGGRLQRSTTGMFLPTDGTRGRPSVPTAGIGASQFLDAGVQAMARGGGTVIDQVIKRVEQAFRDAPDEFRGRPSRIG